MEEEKTNVSDGTQLAHGKLEPQLQVASQAAAGVWTSGNDYSRTDIMVRNPGTKKHYTYKLGSVSP